MQIGDKIKPPYWIEGSEEPSNIQVGDINPFDTSMWNSAMRTRIFIRNAKGAIKTLLLGRHRSLSSELNPLKDVVLQVLGDHDTIRIIDFGGGCGDNYAEFVRAYGELSNKLTWTIIDLQENCLAGRKRFVGNDRVRFCINDSSNSEILVNELKASPADLLFICGTLQYVIPYNSDLERCLLSQPKKVILVRTPMTERDKDYYCRQMICPPHGKYKGRYLGDIKMAVISKPRLIDYMRAKGYVLIAENNRSARSAYSIGLSEFGEIFYEELIFSRDNTDE